MVQNHFRFWSLYFCFMYDKFLKYIDNNKDIHMLSTTVITKRSILLIYLSYMYIIWFTTHSILLLYQCYTHLCKPVPIHRINTGVY